ncbi:universal stress protein [Ensifer sp. B1-9]|uniref:universal stress protein n=1 Tax=Ensifer sp. B1-9 TaxID=3141455 RepID=UPI003D1F8D98
MANDHILVATDGSDQARDAVAMGARLAKAIGADLTVLHVVPPALSGVQHGFFGPRRVFAIGTMVPRMPRTTEILQRPGDGIDESTLALGEEIVAEAANEACRLGVENVDARVEIGDCAETILDTAREIGASMIVVGSGGLGGLQGMILGSVSKTVTKHAHCSVLIIR